MNTIEVTIVLLLDSNILLPSHERTILYSLSLNHRFVLTKIDRWYHFTGEEGRVVIRSTPQNDYINAVYAAVCIPGCVDENYGGVSGR